MDLKRNVFSFIRHGILGPADGGRGFHRRSYDDLAAVADTAHDPAGMVGRLGDSVLSRAESVVVRGSVEIRRVHAFSHLHGFHRAYGHHGLGQNGVQLLEHGRTQSGGNALDTALDHAACAVLIFHTFLQIDPRFSRRVLIRHIKGVSDNLLFIKFLRFHRSDGFRVSAECHAQRFQDLRGNSSRGDSSDRLSSRRPAASSVIPEAVFPVKSIIRMSGSVGTGYISVIPGTLVCVAHHKGDGSSCRLPLKHAGKDLHQIAFLTCGCIPALPRFSPVQVFLDIFLRKRQPRRTSVDHRAQRFPVGLAPGRDRKLSSKC